MKRLIAILLSICTPLWAAPNYTSQTCQNGTASAGTTIACSASMTVAAMDIVVCVGTVSSNITLNSITNTGVTVTWTVNSSMKIYDLSNNQTLFGGWGVATQAGTITPSLNWTGSNPSNGIFCSAFNDVSSVTDGANNTNNAATGSGANAQKSGTITTTVNGDLLVGGIIDTTGIGATVTAGTLSVSYTKIGTCNDGSGARLCMQWGTQTTAASGTEADWTFSNTDRSNVDIIAFNPKIPSAFINNPLRY